MDDRDAFDLTDAEQDVVCALAEQLARAIESACPRLTVQTIDLELRPASQPTLGPSLSAVA